MKRIFGYCRVSTSKQNIERQVRNILAEYPTAYIYKERYTGTVISRREFDKLLGQVRNGDTIVFDSVSRMSRNAAEGIELYLQLYEQGIELVFLKEPHINTATYKQSLTGSMELVGNDIADIYIQATNEVLHLLARKQIELAFGQSEKEVTNLQERTKEGIETARRNGKRIGSQRGDKLNVKKKAPAQKIIRDSSVHFGGPLNDTQCARAADISRGTFYKYLYEIFENENEKE